MRYLEGNGLAAKLSRAELGDLLRGDTTSAAYTAATEKLQAAEADMRSANPQFKDLDSFMKPANGDKPAGGEPARGTPSPRRGFYQSSPTGPVSYYDLDNPAANVGAVVGKDKMGRLSLSGNAEYQAGLASKFFHPTRMSQLAGAGGTLPEGAVRSMLGKDYTGPYDVGAIRDAYTAKQAQPASGAAPAAAAPAPAPAPAPAAAAPETGGAPEGYTIFTGDKATWAAEQEPAVVDDAPSTPPQPAAPQMSGADRLGLALREGGLTPEQAAKGVSRYTALEQDKALSPAQRKQRMQTLGLELHKMRPAAAQLNAAVQNRQAQSQAQRDRMAGNAQRQEFVTGQLSGANGASVPGYTREARAGLANKLYDEMTAESGQPAAGQVAGPTPSTRSRSTAPAVSGTPSSRSVPLRPDTSGFRAQGRAMGQQRLDYARQGMPNVSSVEKAKEEVRARRAGRVESMPTPNSPTGASRSGVAPIPTDSAGRGAWLDAQQKDAEATYNKSRAQFRSKEARHNAKWAKPFQRNTANPLGPGRPPVR